MNNHFAKEAYVLKNKLQSYFPLIRTREEIEEKIAADPALLSEFNSWTAEGRAELLDFMSGAQGVKMLYDSFFKEIMNPELVPERLEELISLLLKQEVKVISVLPNNSGRLADEKSLLEMDILVELGDKSLANIEVQKIGYAFPGERSACYSSDLVLRQYKRIRSKRNKKRFSYRNIKPVYTIILFEESPGQFKDFPDEYVHFFEQKSNTGLELELLQKYLYIPLDIFRERMQNKNIRERSKLDAWLLFLSSDRPEDIIWLCENYPQFKAMYDEVYQMCRNIEKVMQMFSKELKELDQNTVEYMIDEMQAEIDQKNQKLAEKDQELAEQNQKLAEKDQKLAEQNQELAKKDQKLAEKDQKLVEKEQEIEVLRKKLAALSLNES